MTNTSHKIVFFGTEDFSATFLSALIDAGYFVAAVVTKPDSKKGRGQHLSEPLVKTIAKAHGIDVWQPKKMSDIAERVATIGSVAGVLVSYGKIIPESIIDLFTPGIINVHPSLLPRYRGPSPIESAILNGDSETGVSIMQLVKAMDAGPIYSQVALPLVVTETKPELYEKLGKIGITELLKVLPSIMNEDMRPTPQDNTKATYCSLLTKQDGLLDPLQQSSLEAERKIRAFIGYPRTRLVIDGAPFIITKAHIAPAPSSQLDQKFTDGNYLVIDELITPTSGKSLTTEAFLRGYKH